MAILLGGANQLLDRPPPIGGRGVPEEIAPYGHKTTLTDDEELFFIHVVCQYWVK